MISKRTQKYLETALADKQAALEVAIALQSSGGGNVTAEIEQLELDVEILQFDLLNLQSNVQALQNSIPPANSGLATVRQTVKPTITMRAAAAPDSAFEVFPTSCNNGGSIRGDSGIGNTAGQLMTFFANNRDINAYSMVVMTPANENAAAASGTIYASINFGGTWDIFVAVPLADSTYYQWNYVVIYTKT